MIGALFAVLSMMISACLVIPSSHEKMSAPYAEPPKRLTTSASGEIVKVLFGSDLHIGINWAYNKSYGRFINDVNYNITPDALFLLGDMTNSGFNWERWSWKNQTNNITNPGLRDNNTFAVLGNHDMSSTCWEIAWQNWRPVLGYDPNWTVQIGNVLFVGISTQGTDVCGGAKDDLIKWINDTIKANTDRNIILLSHHPPSNTTYKSDIEDRSWKISDDAKLKGMLYWQRQNVSMWVHGHNHASDGFADIVVNWNGITVADISAIECQSPPYLIESYLLNLTAGSNTAIMTPRHSWCGSLSYYNVSNMHTISLKYPFDARTVNITAPTSGPTFHTDLTAIDIGGIAYDSTSITNVTWKNMATGASGNASGTNRWNITGIPLNSGDNTITVTAYAGVKVTGSDTIMVTSTPHAPPSVTGSANITSGAAPLSISFNCTPTNGTGSYTFWWSFGDGGTSTSQNLSHTYTAAGNYTAKVMVTDAASLTANWTTDISVTWPSQPTNTGTLDMLIIGLLAITAFTATAIAVFILIGKRNKKEA